MEAMVGPIKQLAQEGSKAALEVGVQLEGAQPSQGTQGMDARGYRKLAGATEAGGRENPPIVKSVLPEQEYAKYEE